MSPMNIKKSLTLLRAFHVCIWLLCGLWVVLSEAELLPTDYIAPGSETDYALSLITIVTALGGTFFALRFFTFARIRQALQGTDAARTEAAYVRWATVRAVLVAVAVWTNAVIYYASNSATSAKYCLLIAMIATLFCWPSVEEYEKLNARK